ncbi:semaphorin-7A-like [Acipenser oxyrinchus oxyrinchus]|uniref:Semaphorin-7A-like n=1 Tax=Acipenser oxyrinchus oxyrinchus TaxID=40147 RepID=A0AAD8FYN2_ACIOX|nr:semaphorin-7A-like [Acipenser oxyrinchus oxyrinchus]
MSLQVVGGGFFASFWSFRLEKHKVVFFGRAILIWIVVVAGHCENSPRLIISKDEGINRHRFNKLQNNIVFFHLNGSPTLYVGGTDMVCSIDFDANKYMEIPFLAENKSKHSCKEESHCENVITVLHEYQDSLLVCGTNAFKPRCWNLNKNESKVTPAQCSGIGISPFCSTQNSLSLFVEGNIYAAAPLYWQGNSLQFRRISDAKVWMYEKWLDEPTFVSATWVSRKQDPENDKIYMFFREKNPDRSADADPWISRIAQVCKVDKGGPRRLFQNTWTSFLKARLVCGLPKESLYFNRLQDLFVQHSQDWRDTRVYGLFSSSWNSTAVCIYSMDDIDRVFQESDFKGFSGNVPHPRPGTCVPDSRSLPDETINVVRTHPEMEKWVYPLHNEAAILTSDRNYTKILVDQVKGAHGNTHKVMVLATEDGWIHKVLEEDNRPFIISEIHLFNHTAHIHTMTLDHITKRLYVGYAEQIVGLDLQRCQDYDQTCEECVLARDPYCAWNHSHCVPVNQYNSLQNVEDGNTNVCSEQPKAEKLISKQFSEIPPNTYTISLSAPYYLSCPKKSHHAKYAWEHDSKGRLECQWTESDCLHLIKAMTEEDYGTYRCISEERGHRGTIIEYNLLAKPHVMVLPKRTDAIWVVVGVVSLGLCLAVTFAVGFKGGQYHKISKHNRKPQTIVL